MYPTVCFLRLLDNCSRHFSDNTECLTFRSWLQSVRRSSVYFVLCEERKLDYLYNFTYWLSLSKNVEIQRRDTCFGSFSLRLRDEPSQLFETGSWVVLVSVSWVSRKSARTAQLDFYQKVLAWLPGIQRMTHRLLPIQGVTNFLESDSFLRRYY